MTNQPAPDDPRFGFAAVTAALRPLMEEATEHTDKPTPCDDFTVKGLLEHLVMIMERVAAMGNGEPWAAVVQTPRDAGWVDAFTAAAHAVRDAWTDDAQLERTFDTPFGPQPGAPVIYTYTAELATHGWDLATAVGVEFDVDNDALIGALVAAKMLPAEGRDAPQMPFGEVVDPGTDASNLLQIAGWFGRNVASV